MKKTLTVISTLLGLMTPALAASPIPGNKFVLVIGIDGLRGDAVKCSGCANPPTIGALIAGGAFHDNVLAGGAQQTLSGPGWGTQFTGYPASVHGVTSNSTGQTLQRPHVFELIKNAYPTAVTALAGDWANLHMGLKAKKLDLAYRNGAKASQQATDRVKSWLGQTTPPTAIFYYLHNVDVHACCYDPQNANYKSKILAEDGQIKQVLDTLKARPTYATENWLIMIVSDHGGTGSGHGGQSAGERSTVLVMNNTFGNSSHPAFCKGDFSNNSLNQASAMTPHVLAFLGINNPSSGRKLPACG